MFKVFALWSFAKIIEAGRWSECTEGAEGQAGSPQLTHPISHIQDEETPARLEETQKGDKLPLCSKTA